MNIKFGDFVRNKESKSIGVYLGPSDGYDFFSDVMVPVARLNHIIKWTNSKIEVIKENKFDSFR